VTLVASVSRTVERNETYDRKKDRLTLMRKTTKVLQLTPDDIADAVRAPKKSVCFRTWARS
jgi:hypothetical protein